MGPRLRRRPYWPGHTPAHELEAEPVLHDVAHALLGPASVDFCQIGHFVTRCARGTGLEAQRFGEELHRGVEIGYCDPDVRQYHRCHGGTVGD